ncbi:MAG: TIM barrel protein, partial [Pseudomonadota bacterium]
MRHLGLGHFTFLDHDAVALVRLARAAGYDFVGLRFWPVAPGEVHYRPGTPAALAALRDAMAGEGVSLHDVETVVIDEGFDPAGLAPVIEAAAALGARRLNVSADDWDRGALVARLAAIAAMAGEAGLSVDLEPMAWRGIDTPEKCLAVIEATGAATIGYLTDALHHTRCGGTAATLAAMPPARLASVQLCDAPA